MLFRICKKRMQSHGRQKAGVLAGAQRTFGIFASDSREYFFIH